MVRTERPFAARAVDHLVETALMKLVARDSLRVRPNQSGQHAVPAEKNAGLLAGRCVKCECGDQLIPLVAEPTDVCCER